MRSLLVFGGFLVYSVTFWGQASLPAFPQPDRVFKGDKQFNAVRFGPGNTISVYQAPLDLQLDGFDFNRSETLVYLEWGSGRLETRDIGSGKRVAECRPVKGPLWQVHDFQTNQLVIVTPHGEIRFIDSRSCKTLRKIHVEKGKFNYDIDQIILAADGSWLAYVNEDNGKVLDLRTNPPKILADLADGYGMALSPDGKSLWVVDRQRIYGFNVDGWKSIGSANLLDRVGLTETPTLAVLSNHGSSVAFIPSKSALLKYDLPSLVGHKISNIPAYWVASDRELNLLFVHEFKTSALYRGDGTEFCRRQIHPGQDFTISPTGRWYGDRFSGKVELWSTQALINSCPSMPRAVATDSSSSISNSHTGQIAAPLSHPLH